MVKVNAERREEIADELEELKDEIAEKVKEARSLVREVGGLICTRAESYWLHHIVNCLNGPGIGCSFGHTIDELREERDS